MTAPQVILDVDVQNFAAEVVERSQETPVLVDFHAAWCGPCKTLGPILEGLATEFAGGFRLAKIDIDQNPELAEAFATEFCRTSKRYGRQAVAGKKDTQPAKELDGVQDLLDRKSAG